MNFQFPEKSIPPSFNPAPNMFPAILAQRETADISAALPRDVREKTARRIARCVLDVFWLDMGYAHFSAAMQCCRTHQLHEWYTKQAADNRERIARDQAAEREERRALQAA
jgi:hypothetical protein